MPSSSDFSGLPLEVLNNDYHGFAVNKALKIIEIIKETRGRSYENQKRQHGS